VFSWQNNNGSFSFRLGYHRNDGPVFRTGKISWLHLGSYSQGNYNFVKFSRKIRVCDEKNNYIDMIGSTALVLYGYGLDQQLNAADPKRKFKTMARLYTKPIPFIVTANIMSDLSKYRTHLLCAPGAQCAYLGYAPGA
jgi:hypothetical protein